jgi:S1-C subfamily serine protease
MEEPLLLFKEPADEAAREKLDPGCFSGIEVGSARTSLDETEEPPGLLVKKIVENSPGDAAGLRLDDLLLAVTVPPHGEQDLVWPSDWRKVELSTPPGTTITVSYDRAGLTREAKLTLIPRVHPADRQEARRYRETERIGVVVRTATEVEARRAGLAPGAGAVVVGLSRTSPWREAGIVFGDLIVSIGGREVDHPQVVLDAIRNGTGKLEITFLRDGKKKTVEAPLSRREQEVTHLGVPPLFDYENDRGTRDLSILLGVISHKTTPAAWEWRILWIFHFSGGDADRLEEVTE